MQLLRQAAVQQTAVTLAIQLRRLCPAQLVTSRIQQETTRIMLQMQRAILQVRVRLVALLLVVLLVVMAALSTQRHPSQLYLRVLGCHQVQEQ
jgi:hypothetical protein